MLTGEKCHETRCLRSPPQMLTLVSSAAAGSLWGRAPAQSHLTPGLLGLQQAVPAADLLSFGLFHLSPVGQLFLPRAVEAQRDPANHLFALHAALVVDGQDERDVGELEQSHLEDECLFVGGVGLASADGRLTFGHLVAHGVQ